MNGFWRFAYRLALALGEPDPVALMGSMPATVLDGWIEFSAVEPIGEPHADYRNAMLAMLMGNAWLRKKGQRPYRVKDFIPEFGKDAGPSVEELAAKVFAINKALGGVFIDRTKEAA